MENRWSDRKGLHLDVDVYQGGDKLLSCNSRDIGLGGAFLDLSSTHMLNKNIDVELVFYLDVGGSEMKKYALHARVVRVVNEGIGLKFSDFDTGVFRSLQQIMSYKKELNFMH